MKQRHSQSAPIAVGIAAILLLALATSAFSPWAAAQSACSGQWYRVQQGDSWTRLALRTGLTVASLKAANPAAAGHPQGWLLVGQSLCLPVGAAKAGAAPPIPGAPVFFAITVRRGDSWAVLAARYGVGVAALQAANPQAVRASQVLRPGDSLQVPITASMTEAVACAKTVAGYPDAAAAVLSQWQGSPEVLQSYLARCGVLAGARGAVQPARLRGKDQTGIVMAVVDPTGDGGKPLGVVAILEPGPLGWKKTYQSGLAADVAIIAAGDVNDDGRGDVVWTDTTCSAQACFTTPHVVSAVDGGFRSWLDGSATLASATVTLQDVLPSGRGQELVVSGGLIQSVAAGPQRSATVIWQSVDGQPYTLAERRYAASFCLYHHILDADAALRAGAGDAYAAAIAAYRAAADDVRLVSCWGRPDEVDTLRAYALYRLAVARAAAGDRAAADMAVDEMARRYPHDPMSELARLWALSYRQTRDAAAACAVAAAFAERQPTTWQRLNDFGFANPSFTAADVCPVVDSKE